MKLFVTGGTGFIGSHFLMAAIAAKHEVIAIRRSGSLPRVQVQDTVHWIDTEFSEVDFAAFGDLKDSCLIHLAAYGVSPQPCEWNLAFRYNVSDSLKMFGNAIRSGISRAIVCGSCVEYGSSGSRYEFIPSDAPLEPIGAYATSKAAQSIGLAGIAREHDFDLTILRPFTVFGEGQHSSNFWPSLRAAALAGEDFPMSVGTQIRDFVEVGKVAEVFLQAATNIPQKKATRIFNVGSGVPKSLLCFANEQWELAGAQGKILPGLIPMRHNEIVRYVPEISCYNSTI